MCPIRAGPSRVSAASAKPAGARRYLLTGMPRKLPSSTRVWICADGIEAYTQRQLAAHPDSRRRALAASVADLGLLARPLDRQPDPGHHVPHWQVCPGAVGTFAGLHRSEEHTSELQSP